MACNCPGVHSVEAYDRSVLERTETFLLASRGVSRTLSSDRERSKFRASMISKRWLCIGGRSHGELTKSDRRNSFADGA